MKIDLTPDLINAFASLIVTADEHRIGSAILCTTVVEAFKLQSISISMKFNIEIAMFENSTY